MGLPGSGKSSVHKESFPEYLRISQDFLGSKQKCIDYYIDFLKQGKNVLIDRCNVRREDRLLWIGLAAKYGCKSILGVFLDVHPEVCLNRIHKRKGHETIQPEMSLDKKRQIVYNFSSSLELPSLQEGFDSLLITRN